MSSSITYQRQLQSTSQKSKSLFYCLAAAGVAGVLGGIYFLYNALVEEEFNEKEIIEIEEIKEEIDKIGGVLDKDTAIKILYLTNHHAEEDLKRRFPDNDDKRREAINDDYEYKRICIEMLQEKETSYQSSSYKIMSQFNTNMEEVQKILYGIDPQYMEKKFFEFEQPKFDNKPDKEAAKKAYLYFGNNMIKEMQSFGQNANMSYMSSPEAQQEMMIGLLVKKMKVEDFVYLKFKLTETQIRYLLHEYNLLNEPEVMQMHSKLAAFEEMMG